jgi:hypothetical protein
MSKQNDIYSSKFNAIGANPHSKKNDVIREIKTRYMLWPGIKYPMYSLQSSLIGYYLFPDVSKLDYIYTS